MNGCTAKGGNVGFVKTVLDDLTYQVNGLAMQVQSELKPGHREKMYQRRLAELLTAAGLRNEMEKRVEVYVNDSLIGYMFLDLWVEDTLVVECKAFSHQTDELDAGQVVTYLAATGSPVGMLYNFGLRKLEYRRILPPTSVQEWHKYLYRCIWTPPGCTLPPIETITPNTPIRFSVISQPWSPPIQTVNVPPIRSGHPYPFSIRSPIPNPSPIRSSVSRSNPLSNPLSAYTSAGVNITAGNRAIELMRDAVRSTYDARVVAGIGAFGGMFDASALREMRAPVLVASTDGVGTKVQVAAQARRYQSLGQDIVNHCINDILVQGARPLFFLDYLASSQLEPEVVAEIVSGMAAACREARCVLLGGETAEMPGVYAPDAFDVAGTIVGIAERADILPHPGICAGDILIGLRSSGPHTNGYSLIRKVFDDIPLDTVFPEL